MSNHSFYLTHQTKANTSWVVDSQFARIRKLNGFARIPPGYARLLDIVRIAVLLTASPAARIRNSHRFANRTDSRESDQQSHNPKCECVNPATTLPGTTTTASPTARPRARGPAFSPHQPHRLPWWRCYCHPRSDAKKLSTREGKLHPLAP